MEEIITELKDLATSDLTMMTLTAIAFCIAQLIHHLVKSPILHPILVASLVVIVVLHYTDTEFADYYDGNGVLNFMLGISVVCLSYLMHKNFNRIKEYKITILISTIIGSAVGVLSIVGIGSLMGCSEIITLSLEPKSLTMPIALSLSEGIGGLPALTSLAVIVAGISGGAFGPSLLKLFRINDPIARGLAMGSASHAVGTARALELGVVEGAVSGAAIGLMGVFSSILLPLINQILGI